MPRNGQGVYSLPPNTTAVAGQTIESAPYNTVNNDIANDLNAARPVTAGGTGATNAADALDNLGGVGQSNFLDAFSIGDGYYSARTLDARWLRRNGNLYDAADYPELAALLPALDDGVSWTSSTIFTGGDARTIITTPTGYLLLNDDGSNTKVFTSTDAMSWSQVSTITGFRAFDVVRGAGIYVAVDGTGKASVSSDAVAWSTPATINSMTGAQGIAFGASLFVAAGDSGKISTSPDGVTWTSRTSGVAGLLNKVRFVNSLFFAVGAGGIATTSPDGINWTARTTGVSDALYDVGYGASLYVLVGANGRILTTPNLTAYTTRTSSTTVTLNGITYSSSGFMTVGGSGVARISSAGTTWIAAPTGFSHTLQAVITNTTSPEIYYVSGSGPLLIGTRTLPTQFRVPNDNTTPNYGWIKALDEVP
jgi:hypothetical protein